MTDSRSTTAVDIGSPTLREVIADATSRTAQLLTGVGGKTPREVKAQLDAMIETLPALAAQQGSQFVDDDPRFNVPRRFVEVFRSQLLAGIAERLGSTQRDEPSIANDGILLLVGLDEFVRRSEKTSTGRFVARLAGVESVNAVVEIAHDIRSPLSSILFLVDTIRRGMSGTVSPVQERQLGLVYGAALGLSNLSSDLIDAIRGERLVDGRPTPFSITEIILGVCAIVQPIGEEKGLPLHVTYPESDGRIGYPSAISRVLLNLTSNALRYTDSGSVAIGCADQSHGVTEFWVEDTGRGIPESVLAMLFDGFRPGSVGIRFSSAGLGLAISRTLLEAMGSTLAVETSPEQGTRFSFVLELPHA